MPAITLWNRLEPRPRTNDLASTLAAEVRDPLWFLTRQWQLGEFHGEDCGSPAHASATLTTGALLGFPSDGVLAHTFEAEPIAADLLTRIEIGRLVEQLLQTHRLDALLEDLRSAFPLPAPAGVIDADTERVREAALGRVVDGVAFLDAATTAAGWPNAAPPADPAATAALVADLVAWTTEVWGPIGAATPAAWDHERLEYRTGIDAVSPDGTGARLSIHADSRGDLDWYAFDLEAARPRPDNTSPTTTSVEVIPTRARFRGMPNARWWEIETSVFDLGSVRVDKHDIAKLVVLDFVVVAANDWYVIPLELDVGTLCSIDRLVVTDVFGTETHVQRADAGDAASPIDRWTMFSTTAGTGLAPFSVLPAAVTAVQDGPVLEDVRFFRDETANLVWAVEHLTESELGIPVQGHQRSLARRPTVPPPPPSTSAPLRYLLQTDVPEHWIPFVPVIVDLAGGDVALERAAMLRPLGGGATEPIPPVGRILEASRQPYRLREEEVPREGIRVIRRFRRSRGTDGITRLWQSRAVLAGRGEGASGLRYDVAIQLDE